MAFLLSLLKPVAYISVPAIIVSRTSEKGRAYVRLGVYATCMTAVATYAVFVAAGLALIGKKYDVNNVVARSFYAVASRVLDVKVEIEGEEHLNEKRPAVLIMNHQSILDILILGRYASQSPLFYGSSRVLKQDVIL
jgi:lysophosphatidate acyltransferase